MGENTPYWNHTELAWINLLASRVGATKVPFSYVETLQKYTGERFFSEYIALCQPGVMKHDEFDMCKCTLCMLPKELLPVSERLMQPEEVEDV